MNTETKEKIERLRALEDDCGVSGLDVIDVFVGNELYYKRGDKFRDCLIDLLERSDPDGWTDERLRECGLMRLPKDKDGVPICIDDVMYDNDGEAWTVGYILLSDIDDAMLICESSKGSQRTTSSKFLTHRPPVTVESVLREFGDKYIQVVESPNPIVGFSNEIIGEEDPEKTIAEYAKRLRLATEVAE